MEPSAPTHYALVFEDGTTGFDFGAGFDFEDCYGPALHVRKKAEGGFLPGVAFRLANQQLVIARPGGRSLRLERAA